MEKEFEKKSNYLTKVRPFIFNAKIYEYDIHSAGLSLMEYYKLTDKSVINELKSMDKYKRNVLIGNMQRKDASFKDSLSKAFCDIRKEFYDVNDLEFDDIVSVKKDAIFTTKKCNARIFDCVEFVVKNEYTSYCQLKNLEFYYNDEKLDVKGIDETSLDKHTDILSMIKSYFNKLEEFGKSNACRYMNRMFTRYKTQILPVGYYRELNSVGKFSLINSGDKYDDFWEDRKQELDIGYNMQNVFIPMVMLII